MISDKIAVVTGANKGIGYAIVEKLATQFQGIIYLTARNEELGQNAIATVRTNRNQWLCKDVIFHQLDISDKSSVDNLVEHLKQNHNGIDILINNAAIAYKNADPTDFAIQADVTTKINYFGTLNVIERLLPLIKPNGRIVNVSSRAGLPTIIKNKDLYKELMDSHLEKGQLNRIVQRFVNAAKDGTLDQFGFPHTAYGMSKLALSLFSFIVQREVDTHRPSDNILSIPCCPGYVDTDMTSHKGHKTPTEGADTPVFIALLPPTAATNDEFKFQFVAERKPIKFE